MCNLSLVEFKLHQLIIVSNCPRILPFVLVVLSSWNLDIFATLSRFTGNGVVQGQGSSLHGDSFFDITVKRLYFAGCKFRGFRDFHFNREIYSSKISGSRHATYRQSQNRENNFGEPHLTGQFAKYIAHEI